MAQNTLTSVHQSEISPLDYTPGSAATGGDPTNIGGGIIGYPNRDIAASEKGAVDLCSLRRYKKDGTSGPTFAVGDTIIWDDSAGLAVQPSTAVDGSADLPVAICVEAAGTNQDYVAGIPLQVLDRYNVLRPFVVEFDHADTDNKQLIPAWMNRHGLVIEQIYGIVTEQPAGSSEDQLVITVSDESDNALSVLTTTDTTPDAVGDVIIGTNGLWGASTGDALPKTVAAGEYVDAVVTQATAGTPAGKVKLYVVARPLV